MQKYCVSIKRYAIMRISQMFLVQQKERGLYGTWNLEIHCTKEEK